MTYRRCLICANLNPCPDHTEKVQDEELRRNTLEVNSILAKRASAARGVGSGEGVSSNSPSPVSTEPCPCGHRSCNKTFLVGVGSFYQGTGFSPAQAERIAFLINHDPEFPHGE